jgi:hypothetical protein
MSNSMRRWGIGVVAVLALLAAMAALGIRFAATALKGQVERALGPESEIGEITLGWSAIGIHRLRIKGPKGWPAEDTLRARRIVIVPDIRALLSAQVRIHRIAIEDGYISLLRSREGRLRVVPSLLEKEVDRTGNAAASGPAVGIDTVEVQGGVLEFFDATIRRPAHKVRLEQLQATVNDLQVPGLSGRTRIRLDGVVKGVRHDGRLSIHGWAELASRDSEITTALRRVDLIAFQPYLIRAAETGVRRGSLDMDLQSNVRRNILHAPGTLTLTGLELASGSFMGLPRQAVLSALKDRNDQITMHFVLEGNLNDPKFSLNESFATRVGSGIADSLGVSIKGLAKGVGTATRGIGDTVRRLFGQ